VLRVTKETASSRFERILPTALFVGWPLFAAVLVAGHWLLAPALLALWAVACLLGLGLTLGPGPLTMRAAASAAASGLLHFAVRRSDPDWVLGPEFAVLCCFVLVGTTALGGLLRVARFRIVPASRLGRRRGMRFRLRNLFDLVAGSALLAATARNLQASVSYEYLPDTLWEGARLIALASWAFAVPVVLCLPALRPRGAVLGSHLGAGSVIVLLSILQLAFEGPLSDGGMTILLVVGVMALTHLSLGVVRWAGYRLEAPWDRRTEEEPSADAAGGHGATRVGPAPPAAAPGPSAS
jgi:hypothetical protein